MEFSVWILKRQRRNALWKLYSPVEIPVFNWSVI